MLLRKKMLNCFRNLRKIRFSFCQFLVASIKLFLSQYVIALVAFEK